MFSLRFWRFTPARALHWAGWLATLAMLALLAWLGARVFWSLYTPATAAPVVVMETDAARAAQTVAAQHLFGEPAAAKAAIAQPQALPDITLRGVIAASGPRQPAVAVLAIGGKPSISVREGEEVMPGVSLRRVLARQVELERSGQVQSLSLPESRKPGAPIPPESVKPAAQKPPEPEPSSRTAPARGAAPERAAQ
jgi:hypothetical protein